MSCQCSPTVHLNKCKRRTIVVNLSNWRLRLHRYRSSRLPLLFSSLALGFLDRARSRRSVTYCIWFMAAAWIAICKRSSSCTGILATNSTAALSHLSAPPPRRPADPWAALGPALFRTLSPGRECGGALSSGRTQPSQYRGPGPRRPARSAGFARLHLSIERHPHPMHCVSPALRR